MVYAVGLMSGTSLNGIDAALVTIDNSQKSPQVKELAFLTLAYTEVKKSRLKSVFLFMTRMFKKYAA